MELTDSNSYSPKWGIGKRSNRRQQRDLKAIRTVNTRFLKKIHYHAYWLECMSINLDHTILKNAKNMSKRMKPQMMSHIYNLLNLICIPALICILKSSYNANCVQENSSIWVSRLSMKNRHQPHLNRDWHVRTKLKPRYRHLEGL